MAHRVSSLAVRRASSVSVGEVLDVAMGSSMRLS